ncbi:PREDICTED: guanylate-binding protein 4 [Prunus mume]|uniref:Guanylate-binding protein 4 n=1 Tax=Prunus mume TaxID=102107 RepID=A0ABM0NI66_PRUMU|nr:PREDICTED: guanylate-binding protein 4 [Prunus mume]
MRRFFRGRDASSDSSPPTPSFSPSPSSRSSAPVTGPPRPIRLVYCDDNGKFRMDQEAVSMLQLVKEPIGIVAVCGRARQGKSFILNQLLGRSGGFQVASTHRPCTKGLWLWSAPFKRTALDGTEYNLLLLDTEGIDAFDQTETYSTQIFSLAVLLSSMFIYNQMGGIDEGSLDRISLVTQMTKHIRVKASGGTTASEIGQFSPIFVWLLRDFYLDLSEDSGRITPRDYLELALKPVDDRKRDVVAKNEIRASIRALFPDRECFTLVRPLNNEHDLQRLDEIQLDKLRPEFRSGLDALTRFVFERTRPKQVGATMMTGPVLVGITQSYLDALNKGAVPTISSSWQSVEEDGCRTAYDYALEVYKSAFHRPKDPEEAAFREAHEKAVQKSLAAFNDGAVGVGSARKKYEAELHKKLKKEFEDCKRNAYMEAELQCSNSIQSMERKLRIACHASDANIDNVLKVLDGLLADYEAASHGPAKWQKLTSFLQKSLEGPILDLAKRLIDQAGSEKSTLMLRCRSIEDKLGLLNKQLESSEKSKSEYLKRYEDAINDKKKLADEYMGRINNLQSNSSSLGERCSSLVKTLDSAKQESLEWKRKYEQVISKQKAEEDQASSEIAILKSRCSAGEARLAAAREQAQSAQEEAQEWKRKYDIAYREAKAALEKAAIVQERSNKETQKREDALREEFASSLAEKEEEIKDKAAKIEYAEQCLTTLRLELKTAKSKVDSYDTEISSMKLEIKELSQKLEAANAKAHSFEREKKILEQEKIYLGQKYESEIKRLDEVQERCKIAEKEATRATDIADKARAQADIAQKEKSEMQKLAMERLAQIERAERHIETLQREKRDLDDELERIRVSEMGAHSKVALLEARVEEREKEIESLLKSNNEQRTSTVHVLQGLLDSERAAHADANNRADSLSLQLQAAQAKLDSLQQELTSVRLNETALDSKLKTASHGKRSRVDDYEMGMDSVQDMEMSDRIVRVNKRSRSTTSPLKRTQAEDGGSVFKGDEDTRSQQTNSEDYRKFTVMKIKQELTKHNFGAQVLDMRTGASKREWLELYESCMLQKS